MKQDKETEKEILRAQKQFRPPMNTAEDLEHEEHIKKLREQDKKQA